jgi:hypothetical protein
LSEYDVPDDDMPDSQTPISGPAPYEERDLDNLLSGNAGYIPDALRPVARTLAALRAAPTHAELAGEAAARAEFRRYRPAGSRPVWTAPAAGNVHPLASSLRLPRSRRPPRHRRPSRGVNWRVVGTLGAAAAAVLVVVAALGGAFSGSAGKGQLASSSSSPRGTGGSTSGSGLQGVEGRASNAPTARPTPHASGGQSATGPDVPTLCREYFASLAHPADWAEQNALVSELSEPAGGRWSVEGYCYKMLSEAGDYSGNPWYPGHSGNAPGQQGPGSHPGGPGQYQGGQGR